jgi:hypothetical protein
MLAAVSGSSDSSVYTSSGTATHVQCCCSKFWELSAHDKQGMESFCYVHAHTAVALALLVSGSSVNSDCQERGSDWF